MSNMSNNQEPKNKKSIADELWFPALLVLVFIGLLFVAKTAKASGEDSHDSHIEVSQAVSNVSQTAEESVESRSVESRATSYDSGNDSVVDKTEKEKLSYEITDTILEITDEAYGDGKRFKVIIEVTNTGNVPMYLDDCVLDFEDDNGHLLHTYDFVSAAPDIVQPGECGYFYADSSFEEGTNFDNGCNLVPKLYIEKAKGELKSHDVEDVSLYDGSYGSVGCRGRIVNDTNEDISNIYITVVYYGEDGRVLDITGTNTGKIRANDSMSFDISGILGDDFCMDDVSYYKIFCDEFYLQF